MLDEFPAPRTSRFFESALAFMAGYGPRPSSSPNLEPDRRLANNSIMTNHVGRNRPRRAHSQARRCARHRHRMKAMSLRPPASPSSAADGVAPETARQLLRPARSCGSRLPTRSSWSPASPIQPEGPLLRGSPIQERISAARAEPPASLATTIGARWRRPRRCWAPVALDAAADDDPTKLNAVISPN